MSPRGARTGRASGAAGQRAAATDPAASATTGLEAKLWQSADMLRNNMDAIERENPALKGVLPKDFARPGLDKARLAQLINLVSDISVYGQESNYTTWRLANMNLAIRGIGSNIAQGDSFHAGA